MMKRCQKCNFQSDAMLDYCWQCGAALTNFSNAGNFDQNNQAGFHAGTPNNHRPPQAANFNNYGQNFAPNYEPQRTVMSVGRIAAVLGSVFVFLLLVSGAGAAVIYRVINKPPVRRDYTYRDPEPVRPAVRESEPVKNDPASDKRKSNAASAAFEKIWVDYNVKEKGRLGMRIHVKFSVYNMKDVDSQLAIYFEKSDGTKLKSTNRKFTGKDGQVAVFRALKPGFDDTVYKDLEVFMPYEELKLEGGKYNLKMDADVIYENGGLVEHLGYHDFLYEKN